MYRFAFLLLVAPTVAIASDPLECVDPEFVQAFLSGSHSGPVSYSTKIPENFEVRALPSDMTLVGSRLEKYSTTVLFRTSHGVREVNSRLASLLSEQGWEDITYEENPGLRGFQPADRPPTAQYCQRSGDKRLSVAVSERSDQTIVSLHQYVRKTLHGCLEILRERRRDLRDSLPILNPPDGTKTTLARKLSNVDEVSTSVAISGGISRKVLREFYGDQIREQDWTLQTKWSSEFSAGSVWLLDTTAYGRLIGTLHLYDSGSDPVTVRFSIVFADPQKGIDHGVSAQYSGACG